MPYMDGAGMQTPVVSGKAGGHFQPSTKYCSVSLIVFGGRMNISHSRDVFCTHVPINLKHLEPQ